MTDDELVEKIHKLMTGWAYLISRGQIRGVLDALAHIEKKEKAA